MFSGNFSMFFAPINLKLHNTIEQVPEYTKTFLKKSLAHFCKFLKKRKFRCTVRRCFLAPGALHPSLGSVMLNTLATVFDCLVDHQEMWSSSLRKVLVGDLQCANQRSFSENLAFRQKAIFPRFLMCFRAIFLCFLLQSI